jgi:hypothetical protein
MDSLNGRKIEIFAPFSAAFDLTKLILFQPFDIGKWFTIGFAAFLSHLAGGGFNFNFKNSWRNGDWNWKVRSATHDTFGFSDGMPAWLLPLIVIGGVFLIVLVLALMWIGSRGKFIFTDCIVRNRGAIVEPWNEFKREGNSYFLFLLVIAVSAIAVVGLVSIPFWLPVVFGHEPAMGPLLVIGLIFLALVFIGVAIFLSLIFSFMVPVMYRRRCGAMEGFRAALGAITAQPGPVLLYLLFLLVLGLAVAMIACLSACVTCCITAIPYIGTVILLPLYVFLTGYMLLFVRQFGTDYDAWGNIVAIEPVAPPEAPPAAPTAPEPPPVQG